MTPRSRKYLSRKKAYRYRERALAFLISVSNAIWTAMDAYAKLTKPIPQSPQVQPGGPAIVGDGVIDPEFIDRQGVFEVGIKRPIMALVPGTRIIPQKL